MKCHRCGHMMVYESFYGPEERFWGWKCIYCGEIVDHVILENRGFFKKKLEKTRETEQVRGLTHVRFVTQ